MNDEESVSGEVAKFFERWTVDRLQANDAAPEMAGGGPAFTHVPEVIRALAHVRKPV